MKKTVITLFFASLFIYNNAQNNFYQNLKALIHETHPEIITANKLIAFNIWSVQDSESRELNKSFEEVYKVYESALLKGGKKGIIVISFNKENLSSEAVIAYHKDGIVKLIPFKWSDLDLSAVQVSNAVYDSDGNEVYRNLSATTIYKSINRLITR